VSVRLALTLATLLLAVGCGEQRYTIRAWNEGKQELRDVRVWYGRVMTSFGYLGPSIFKAKNLIRHPPADVAEVSWTDSRGEPHRVKVDISKLVPKHYDHGVLTFEIHADQTVTAGFFIPKKLPFESG